MENLVKECEKLKKGDIVFAQYVGEIYSVNRYRKGKIKILRAYKYRYLVEVLEETTSYQDTVDIVRIYTEKEWQKMEREKEFRNKYIGQSSQSLEKILENTEKRADELRKQYENLNELANKIREFIESEKE